MTTGFRRFFATTALLAAVAAGLSWAPVSPVAAAPAEAAIAKGRLFKVLTPGDDALIRSNRVRVRLALKPNVTLRSAQLNGRRITRLFSPEGSSTRRVAVIRKSEMGKRFSLGRNFLSFVVRRGGAGGKRDFEEVAFTRVRRTPGLIRKLKVDYDRSGGLEVKVLPSTLSAKFKVTLNGQNVSKQFRTGQPLSRRVLLGASDGLKHGVNRLIVRAHTHHGQYLRLRRTFTVGKKPTIAGAGPDKVVPAGRTAQLASSGSRKSLTKGGEPVDGNLDFAWKLVRRPVGSEAVLDKAGTRQPQLLTDIPGTYTAELRTGHDELNGSASTDTVTVIADAQPLPAVNTFASEGGKNGIRIGVTRECGGSASGEPPCFFANPGSDQDLQMLVLDRRTLEMKSNRSFSADNLSAFADAMKKFGVDQAGKCPAYDSSKIILLALRAQPGLFDAGGFNEGISVLNTRAEDDGNQKAGCPVVSRNPMAFPFSMIGIPGNLENRAWVNQGIAFDDATLTPGAKGALDGYLKRSSDDPSLPASTRSFTSATAIGYDTRRPGAGGRSEYVIGNKAVRVVPDELPADADGLAIFSFDPFNPERTLQREAFIGHAGGATDGLDWAQMLATLEALNGKKGIGITSNGQIGRFATEPKASSFPAILEELESVYRANADTFARAVNQEDGKGTYSMIAVPPLNRLGGGAFQSSSAMIRDAADDDPAARGRLTGTIQRANNGRVFPSDGDITGSGPAKGVLQAVFAPQQEWPLTPEPGKATANCQQTAFAYLATRFDGLFPGGLPELWKNPNVAACQGKDHTGTDGVRRADNLDSNSCAVVEPNATGAVGPEVRRASMALRTAYQAVNSDFSQAQVQGVTRPADAPFTDADLTCAKNQMIDELAAREQVTLYMDVLKRPQQNLQGQTVVNFGQIAENVKTAALADYRKQIEELKVRTPNFWAHFALGSIYATGSVGAVLFPSAGLATQALQLMGNLASGGQAIFNSFDMPRGNPVAATNAYLLLASDLDQQRVEIEVQMQRVLAAQQNGVIETEGILMSDPHKLAEVNAAAKGSLQITAKGLQAAQDAYQQRTIQMAYQAFWPQLYSAYRVSYRSSCQLVVESGGPFGTGINKTWCIEPTRPAGNDIDWSDGRWWYKGLKPTTPPSSIDGAAQLVCGPRKTFGKLLPDFFRKPFRDANTGSPAGIGAGNEYRPLTGVAPKGQVAPFQVYVMSKAGNPGELADMKTVAPFFRQKATPDPGAAGFYPPFFWEQSLKRRSERVGCKDSREPATGQLGEVTNTGGDAKKDNFYNDLLVTDIWPSPGK